MITTQPSLPSKLFIMDDYEVGDYRICCPNCAKHARDKTAGLKVDAPGKGVLHCFRCGKTESYHPHGVKRLNSSIKAQPKRLFSPHRHESISLWGHGMWNRCVPVSGVALKYLQHRKCRIPPEDGHLRCHPALKHPSGYVGPALVGLVTDAITGKPLSLHRTWVLEDGKAHLETPRLPLVNHSLRGGCIRLWPDESVTLGLGIAEGIETALSLAWAYTPVWATIDAGHMKAFPVLQGIETLFIGQDQDLAGQDAAMTSATRWANADRDVRVTTQLANDLNDVLMGAV